MQELYRLALCICWAITLLGAWRVINYHPALLALLPALFLYQFSSYFTKADTSAAGKRQRLAMALEFSDGVLTGVLLAFVGFALLLVNMARHSHFMLAEQHDSVRRQNEWLTLRTFRLSKYLSPPLRKAILTGKDVRAETQEKTLTIFFSDMAGFTKLAEELDPEQLTSLLNTYLTEMSEIAFRFGGTIDKVIGDSIMVFFGDPESRGVRSDAVTCVSMAIAMRKAMEDLQLRWHKEGIERPPALRMGINSGLCKVGNFGTENRLDYTLLGRAVNLASRLESSAESNEILLSEDTYGLVKDTIHCIHKGQISIKGFSEAVNVYSAIDLHKHLKADYPPVAEKQAIA